MILDPKYLWDYWDVDLGLMLFMRLSIYHHWMQFDIGINCFAWYVHHTLPIVSLSLLPK